MNIPLVPWIGLSLGITKNSNRSLNFPEFSGIFKAHMNSSSMELRVQLRKEQALDCMKRRQGILVDGHSLQLQVSQRQARGAASSHTTGRSGAFLRCLTLLLLLPLIFQTRLSHPACTPSRALELQSLVAHISVIE